MPCNFISSCFFLETYPWNRDGNGGNNSSDCESGGGGQNQEAIELQEQLNPQQGQQGQQQGAEGGGQGNDNNQQDVDGIQQVDWPQVRHGKNVPGWFFFG